MDDVNNISEIISDACQGIDFKTMQIGVHIPKDLMEEEDAVRSRYGAPGSSPLKATFVEEIQATLQAGSTDIEFVKERPDIMILIDTLTLRVEVDVRPVFIYGRYIKKTKNSGQLGGEELRKQAIESNSDLQEIESMDHCPCLLYTSPSPRDTA